MDDSEKGLDLYNFISGMKNVVSTGLSDYICNYASNLLYQYADSSALNIPVVGNNTQPNGFLQNMIMQYFCLTLNQFMNQCGASYSSIETELHQLSQEHGNQEDTNNLKSPDEPLSLPAAGLNPVEENMEQALQDKYLKDDVQGDHVSNLSASGLSPETNSTPEAGSDASYHPCIVEKTIDVQPYVMETHDSVIIRIIIPEGISPDDLKISINKDHAIIKWESGYLQQIVCLPPDTIQNQANATVKNNIVEIKIPRAQVEIPRFIPIQNQ